MELIFQHHDQWYRCETQDARSIAIELDFDGPQPNHFGAPPAASVPLLIGGFVGDTAAGGSCNVDSVTLIPHCNGTHTETIGHIVSANVWVGRAVVDALMLGVLVTIDAVSADRTAENYRPPLAATDQVLTAMAIEQALREYADLRPIALIVRTRPNSSKKTSRVYRANEAPPFFTVQAMECINRWGLKHLLVDVPSIDRMQDEGKLTNHHLFWHVAEETHQLTGQCNAEKTITEMIFVDDEIVDGLVLLNLQIPSFRSDAAPSRPIIWPIERRSNVEK